MDKSQAAQCPLLTSLNAIAAADTELPVAVAVQVGAVPVVVLIAPAQPSPPWKSAGLVYAPLIALAVPAVQTYCAIISLVPVSVRATPAGLVAVPSSALLAVSKAMDEPVNEYSKAAARVNPEVALPLL